MDIDKTSAHYKGEFDNIYEVNKKFPNGGVEGDYVAIDGWAHYWNPDRGTWSVNAERDSYWDEKLSALKTYVEQILEATATETSERKAADEALEAAYKAADAAIEAAYKAADKTLQDNIDAEASAREKADTTLQGNIDAEAAARKEADAAEADARQKADTTLQENIDAEAASRKEADAALDAAYKAADEAEASARKAADEAIEAAYKAADEALETAYKAADSGLQEKIDALGKAGYRLMGVAAPGTSPGKPTENVFYVALKAGDYSNFGTGQNYLDDDGVSHEVVVSLADGEVALLLWRGRVDTGEALTGWRKQTLDLSVSAVKAVKDGLGGVSGGYAKLGDDLKVSEDNLPESVTGEPSARKAADEAIETAYKAADTVLQANIDTLAKSGYRLMGVAVPGTNPGAPTENVFYVAREAGSYTHFTRMGTAVGEERYWSVEAGEIAFLIFPGYTGDGNVAWAGGWEKQSISCPTGEITGEQVVEALGYTPMDEAKATAAITNAAQAATNATNAAANAQQAIANANKAAQDVAEATEEASRVDAELKNGVLTVTNRKGETSSVNIGDAYEQVEVKATTSVSGVTLEGTSVSLYLNKSTTPLTQTLDSAGSTVFTIARGTYFEIVLADKAGCKSITAITGTATGGNTTYNVAYEAYDSEDVESVTVNVRKRADSAWSGWSGQTVHVKIGTADAVDYTSDSNGQVTFSVQTGQTYTVSMDEDSTGGYYMHLGVYSKEYTAKTTNRVIWMDWYEYRTGVFLVGSDGVERTADEWDAAGMTETDGVMLKVVTQALKEGGGVIYVKVDDLASQDTTSIPSKQWATGAMQTTSIDGIANSTTSANYYNGSASTDIIIAACEANDCEAPAASFCREQSVTIGSTTMTGYLGSVGQWVILWNNRTAVDELITKLKGSEAKLLSTFTTNKWTSTQYYANDAMQFTASPVNYVKNASFRVVVFYA